jgi:protein phosphatase
MRSFDIVRTGATLDTLSWTSGESVDNYSFRSTDRFMQQPPQLEIQLAARTDTGPERSCNEDRALVGPLGGTAHGAPVDGRADATATDIVLAICDGMGGEAGGEIASGEAVETLRTQLLTGAEREEGASAEVTARRLVEALRAAARTIHHRARLDPSLSRMGTTATVAVLSGGRLVLGQVGDSRAYLLRRGALTQLTRDQSLTQILIEQGRLQPEEAKSFAGSHVILQAVGTSPHVDVDVRSTRVTGGDVLLLCSDGLSGPLEPETLRAVLGERADPGAACDELIRRALAAGGRDNVTCIVARIVGAAADLELAPTHTHFSFEPAPRHRGP